MANPYLPTRQAMNNGGPPSEIWRQFFENVAGNITTLQTTLAAVLGVNRFALASQPALGASDTGYVGFVTDYAHLVYFDGAAWQWLDGDRPGRFQGFDADPGTGWGLCDGTTYAALVIGGATLTTRNIVTPNLSGTAAYLKSGAAYTGSIVAGAGSTGTGTTGTGTTGNESAHTHDGATLAALVTNDGVSSAEYVSAGGQPFHVAVSGSTGAGSAHSHSVPGLSVPGLGIGTIDPAHLTVLPYVRR